MAKTTDIVAAFNTLTDADIRQMVEDGHATMSPILMMIAKAPKGEFMCPRCCGSAYWIRTGRDWSADCDCGWSAAGMISTVQN